MIDPVLRREILLDSLRYNVREGERNLSLIKKAPWRLIRNRGLLDRNKRLILQNARIMLILENMKKEME